MKHFCLPRLGRFHAVERSRGLACREERPSSDRRRTRERKVHSSAAPLSSAAGQRTRARRVQPHQRRRRHMDALLPCIHARRRRSVSHWEHRLGPTDTRERVSSRVSRRWHLRVPWPQPQPRTCCGIVWLGDRGFSSLALRIINNLTSISDEICSFAETRINEANNEARSAEQSQVARF